MLQATTDAWVNYAEQSLTSAGLQLFRVEPSIEIAKPDPEQSRIDPVESLFYYSALMDTLSTSELYWKSIFQFLEQYYDKQLNQSIADSKGAKGATATTKANLYDQGLESAVLYCEIKADTAKRNYKTSENYRDLVSRCVTITESERKVTRHM